MKFPNIGDIATTEIVSIDINSSFNQAMNKMLDSEHRNIIVIDLDQFYILSIIDILNIQTNDINLETALSDLELQKIPVMHKDKNILQTLEYLNNSIEYICVVNDDNLLY